MDERAERIGRNEALFRAVNHGLEGLNETFATITETFEVVCECGNDSCTEQLVVPTELYERVRSDSTLFIIVPGHELPDTESVVDRGEGYFVVKKDPGDPAELARATDPE